MFLTGGVVLLVLWLLGFLLLKKTVGAIIHILLIIAVIAICIHFLGGAGMGTS
ncbi:MAG TPA: lmo0937 family membrane protein [Gemmatimonadaceae bacterium]|nr:lmo0937 family membrane protein [Gemmatimonadaceae bacterium]